MNKDTKELVEAVSAIHAAHTNALIVLVKTLNESGHLDPAHYAANIRMTIDANRNTIGPGAQRLLMDIASLLDIEDDTGTA
ncbi:hypothetical protein GB927_033670 [Shinella sp. CPCC 100929]|uniref:Uncharacterized protein n=1 Tax=Shinella lacus TaxID=2654216 RepID=A0ABT1RIL9_9HYPH|nr:hypothetical protein [Shinella lacus]MCQ4635015.1 hypothetical protein [Shinella lacus]